MREYLLNKKNRFMNRQRQEGNTRPVRDGSPFKVAYWNANGFSSSEKKEYVEEAMEQGVKIMCISETHLRIGNQEDLSRFEGYGIITNERGFGDKIGGGLLTLIKPGVSYLAWKPIDKEFPETAKEKDWILVHEGAEKLALCFVYMAAQSTVNEDFMEWNRRLYCAIQRDVEAISSKEYKCIIMGDFNGHVGNGPDGIPGNSWRVNYNGELLQNFIRVNNMTMVNADLTRTVGRFTRSAGGFSTILDYTICSQSANGLIKNMHIDEEGNILSGSDHASIMIELDLPNSGSGRAGEEAINKITIPVNAEFSRFHASLDEELQKVNWAALDIEMQCEVLQVAMRTAGTRVFGGQSGATRAKRKAKVPYRIRRLRQLVKRQDQKVKRASADRARKLAAGGTVTEQEKMKLNVLLNKLQKEKEKIKKCEIEHNLKARKTLRKSTKLGSKEFWRLVKKVVKQSSRISAVEDEDGKLITDRQLIEDIVLEELAKIFKGERSEIFEFKGEQLLSAAHVFIMGTRVTGFALLDVQSPLKKRFIIQQV